jgi:hypothetical protein
MRIVVCFIIFQVLIFSCGPSDDGNMELDANDSIVEFSIDEERTSAIDFNNDLTLMQQDILDAMDILFQSDSSNIDLNLENTLFEIEMHLGELRSLNSFEGGGGFVKSMFNLMEFYQEELKGGFQEMVPLLKKSKLSESEKNQLEAYDLSFAAREKEYFESVIMMQEEFAQENNISLEGL